MRNNRRIITATSVLILAVTVTSCKLFKNNIPRDEKNATPEIYANSSQDTLNSGQLVWKEYFTDENLIALIDSALVNNQEFNIVLQEIEIAKNEVRARKGEYLPFVGAGADAGVEKVGRNTSQGASDEVTEIAPGINTPQVLPSYQFGLYASWEIDIWKKLRNAKKSAFNRFLGTIEGTKFFQTNLVAEIANSYYELLALDNQLAIVKQNIEIQSNALSIVRLEKEATRVTELAVRKFEAEVYHTRSLQFDIQQKIIETENRINFLVGRFPQPITRNAESFNSIVYDSINPGIPSQLLNNRTDIKQAELGLVASKLDVKVAKAKFYPSLAIGAGVGYQAFNPAYLLKTPQSLLLSVAGGLAAPLINRNAIKADFFNANAKQLQAIYNYEQTILNAYIEVSNQVSKIDNLEQSYSLKLQQVEALNQSITISTNLFASARADYMEVLLTQRDALESKFELIETKKELMMTTVNIYRALGGGWR